MGMPGHVLGEKGFAYVMTKGKQPLNLGELFTFLQDVRHISTFKLPERLELVSDFPMTQGGKIGRSWVQDIRFFPCFPLGEGTNPSCLMPATM